jgi:hypothetical protein
VFNTPYQRVIILIEQFPEQWLKRHREAGSSTLGLHSARVEHTQLSSRPPARKGSRAGDTPTRNVSQDHAHTYTRRGTSPQRSGPPARAGDVLDTPGLGLDTPAGVLDTPKRVFVWPRDSSATRYAIDQYRAVQRHGGGQTYPHRSTRVTSTRRNTNTHPFTRVTSEETQNGTRTRTVSRESRPKKNTKEHEHASFHVIRVRRETQNDTNTQRFT